jgi:hypothetical protein
MKRLIAGTAVAALAIAGCGSDSSPKRAATTGVAFAADSHRVTNPWFPIAAGDRWVYRGVKDGKTTREVVRATGAVKAIGGVRCAVIEDLLYTHGRVSERTTDWYAQDSRGVVWYFGEATAELRPDGRVKSTEGSWQAGRHGARQGVFMPAHPRVGQTAAQEHFSGHAEDHFRVTRLPARVSSPAVSSTHALLTSEWTPLEPGVLDHKLYVRGVGTVREETAKGPQERNVLVSFKRR